MASRFPRSLALGCSSSLPVWLTASSTRTGADRCSSSAGSARLRLAGFRECSSLVRFRLFLEFCGLSDSPPASCSSTQSSFLTCCDSCSASSPRSCSSSSSGIEASSSVRAFRFRGALRALADVSCTAIGAWSRWRSAAYLSKPSRLLLYRLRQLCIVWRVAQGHLLSS